MHRIIVLLDNLSRSTRLLIKVGPALLQNRLELFSLELREETCRVLALLIWACLGVFFTLLAVVLATLAVILAVPGDVRLIVMVCFAAGYALLAAIAYLVVRQKTVKSPRPFAATIGEIAKDRECF